MKSSKTLLFGILISIVTSTISLSQNTEKHTVETAEKTFLKGLRKPGKGESSNGVVLDGESVPVYTLSGEKIKGKEISELLMSRDYLPSAYLDENKEIKAFLLRPTTKEERAAMEQWEARRAKEQNLKGTQAAPFSVTDINGNTFSLQNLKGKVVVINFWFIGCKPCVREIPDLNEIVQKNKEKNVVFLGFATDDKLKLESFLKKKQFDYNIVPATRDLNDEYGVSSYPTHMVIDQDSKITFVTSGLSSSTTKILESEIARLLK